MLGKLEISNPNRFRKHELAQITASAEALKKEINEATTIEELEEISLTAFEELDSSLPTNASYTARELINFPKKVGWDLVNQHAANYTLAGKGKIMTPGNPGSLDVGYAITDYKFSGALSGVIKLETTETACENVGFLIGNPNETGNGFDGYLINYNVASDHQYLQIWYFKNANAAEAAIVYQYIGGWIYQDSYPTLLANDDIRFIYTGEEIKLYNNADYLKLGDDAPCVSTPLAFNNEYAIDPKAPYSVGFFNWDGAGLNTPRGLSIKELATEKAIDSYEVLDHYLAKVYSGFESSLYEEDEVNAVNEAHQAIINKDYENKMDYELFMKDILDLKALIASSKTHEQKELERHPDVATTILDNMYSTDETKYTPSNWALVNEHARAWKHDAGSNTIVTDGLAGYIMDNETHKDFTMTFSINGAQVGNPYGGPMTTKAFCFGCSINGDYFDGYALTLSYQDNGDSWIQIHKLSAGISTSNSTFIGGIGGMNPNGVKFKVTVKSNVLTISTIDDKGVETKLKGINPSFAEVYSWSVPNSDGKFAILDWGDTPSTFTLYEYRNL